MASSQSTVDFICEQMGGAGSITSRKMFGEYAIYVNGKIIAFVCDDSLFIKPNASTREFFPEAEDAPPYPGAKMYLLIPEEKWEDTEFMSELASITFIAFPSLAESRRASIAESRRASIDSKARRARRADPKPKKKSIKS